MYEKRNTSDFSSDAFDLTTQILTLNPEFQTAWAFRRRILQFNLATDADAEARQRRLETDLQLTNVALLRNPKNYSVWEHRKWVLNAMPAAHWGAELALVDMYLQKDGRNFHTWDYQFEFVRQALWSDPNDQSAWLYHRWLVGRADEATLRREIEDCVQLRTEEPQCRWILESLVAYKRMLAQNLDARSGDTSAEAEGLRLACIDLLRELEAIDPMRRARYEDLLRQFLPARR
ncbi:protein prenylyltransferase [Rhodotorula sp. JG-1b]|nr:protein prenylyltransferase [Rhodotorula sp. JG-1b]